MEETRRNARLTIGAVGALFPRCVLVLVSVGIGAAAIGCVFFLFFFVVVQFYSFIHSFGLIQVDFCWTH